MSTKFQEAVYELTRQIPKGRVSTYKDIANTLGTGAYRAVGSALNKNPDAPKTPCHRVVNSNGNVGGFAFLPEKKRMLLRKEGVVIKNDKIDLKTFSHSFL